jgi:hypothetical protein
MSIPPLPLPLLAEAVTRTTFEWGRIQSNSDFVLPIVVCLAIMVFVRQMYRRDARELSTAASWLLTALRTLAFYGLLVLYLQPQWRTEQEVTRNSRVLIMADTSLSMGLTDVPGPQSQASISRAREVTAALQNSDFLSRLRQTHDVAVLRFDQELSRIASLAKLSVGQDKGSTGVYLPLPGRERAGVRGALLEKSAGKSAADSEGPRRDPNRLTPNVSLARGEGSIAGEPIDWSRVLAPRGVETRLGQALRQALHDEQSSPLAGIVVFTDGGQNAGVAPDAAIRAARENKVPIFLVGVGSERQPAGVRISDLAAPPRAFPGDHYMVTGYLQAQKMAGRVVTVELLSRDAGGENEKNTGPGQIEATQRVTLGGDGEVVPVKFEITPEKTGRRTLTLRVKAPEGEQRPGDNQREVDVEIVDQKNRVLLFAGGPNREYQFLRGLLYRDRSTTVDVLLQTAQPGISQDAAKVLDDFPSRREEMFAYDCVIALDPDWQALRAAQVDVLEKWVAEQGGGLIAMAGPVFTGKTINSWIQDPQMAKIRALYPVEFQRTVAALDSNTFVANDPWPLDFTREGMEAEYLWLDDSTVASQQAWGSFPGVYSFQPLRGPKPSATVLARFSDPRAAQAGQEPVYFASQFYGSGRVFYLGSAEMWRLRRVEESYFEKFYTKLIRYVSQGRLLRGSSRGVLLVGQDQGYLVGSTVQVRAQLTNAQLEPLDARSVPLQLFLPDRSTQTVVLRPDPSRAGTFAGHFTAAREGTYRLELAIPDSDEQRLTRRLQVRVPDLELENPQRNDALLSRIANQSGGRYYVGPAVALAADHPDSIVRRLKDRTKTIILTAAPDHRWEQTWMGWLMAGLCAVLCLEWLIRRLLKLA